MTRLLDQQYVVHLYAPAQGPDAPAAYRGLCEIWRGCRLAFQMSEPVEGLGLPHLPPSSPDEIPERFDGALAVQERPFADSQAVLRRHHDVFNLSVALAPPETRLPRDGAWTWWRDFDRTWNAISSRYAPHMLGEARLFLAGVCEADADTLADDHDNGIGDHSRRLPELFNSLHALIPDEPARHVDPPPHPPDTHGVALDPAVRLWEPRAHPPYRSLRRLLLAVAPGADDRASRWVWSDGGVQIPPLARYLLHAAKLRYEMRVWRRDGQGRELSRSLDALSGELVRAGLDAGDAAPAQLLRVRSGQALLLLADLRLLRQTAEIAAENMRRALSGAPQHAAAGPFAQDSADAAEFLEQLDDQIAYLDTRATRSATLLPLAPPVATAAENSTARNEGDARAWVEEEDRDTVFVVHGRDERARVATHELLRAFGLHPVEWDEAVGLLGQPMPFLGRVLREAIPRAKAVVVIMTPDDIVRLHPELAGPHEPGFETGHSMQARPNVLIELGMALAYHPRSTLILQVGEHRPIADLGGFNYVRVAEGTGFRERIGRRLMYADCRVHMPPDGAWRTAGDFGPAEGRRPNPS